MRCSNCGKDIPFVGNVCPWCNVDKSQDQRKHASATLGALFGMVVGFFFNPCLGVIVGGIVGGLVGIGISSKLHPSSANATQAVNNLTKTFTLGFDGRVSIGRIVLMIAAFIACIAILLIAILAY